jgi:mannuronan 5-epimerase
MKELKSNSIASIFIVILFLSIVSSGLLSKIPQVAVASENFNQDSCVNYDSNTNTITVVCDSSLSSIYDVINDSSVLEKDPNGIWIVNAIIKVMPLATITINPIDTSWLKITNKNGDEPNFISIYGNAKIDGVKITSWDPMSNQVIRENANGSIPRAHIIVEKGAGRVNVSNSEIAFLGYASNPSNGFLFRYGGDGSNIVNNTFHDMYDGFYSDGAKFITIKDNKYYNNLRYGIDPHTGSHDLRIIGNTAYNNTSIGIICSEDCYNILFDSNIAHNNGNAGLMFSLNTNNSTARKNYVYNEKVGISIYGSSNDKVYNNIFKSSHTAIFIAENASNNHIYNNTIADVNIGLEVRPDKAKNNLLENNHIQNVSRVTNIGINNDMGRHNVIYNSSANIPLPDDNVSRSLNIKNPSIPIHTIAHDRDRIAFVEPAFTYAAYQNGSFYNFYKKHSGKNTPAGQTVSTDLNLLRNRPIPHGPFPYYAHPTQKPDIPYIDYFNLLLQHVKKNSPFVRNLTDVDVHEGKIFQSDGRNAYDVLFLFHNEYATASEYNNLRQFARGGGTIVFTESNTLFAEVSYNKMNDSITLVKGHYWKFDGKSATPSVSERWLNENKEWTGSNFLDVISTAAGVNFANNPFNYTHSEEQYVTNPQARILIDYHVYNIPRYYKQYQNATVATYHMNYGQGKVIVLGLWGHRLINNKAFLNYFDNTIIPLALGPPLVNSTQYP